MKITKANFDANVINAHEPTSMDITTDMYATGRHMVKIINLPFEYEEEVADELTLAEAQRVKRAMLRGKTYADMMRLARLEVNKHPGRARPA